MAIKAYSYFPIAVAKDVDDFRDGEITVRFKGIRRRIDQGAGVLFNMKPNGDYLTLRLENNLVLWKVRSCRRFHNAFMLTVLAPPGVVITAMPGGLRYSSRSVG